METGDVTIWYSVVPYRECVMTETASGYFGDSVDDVPCVIRRLIKSYSFSCSYQTA